MNNKLILRLFWIGLFLPSLVWADNKILLYDVDFSGPHHRLDKMPLSGIGPIPRKIVTYISKGEPRVVDAFEQLDGPSLLFSGAGQSGYVADQVFFNIDYFDEFSHYQIEMDILIDPNSSSEFNIIFNTPQVRTISFKDNKISNFIPGQMGLKLGNYTPGAPLHLMADIRLGSKKWSIYLDGYYKDGGDFYASMLESVALSGTSGCVAAMDNFKVYGVCDSKLLMLKRPFDREDLTAGAIYPIEWCNTGYVDQVNVEYSLDKGASWQQADPPNSGNTGTYNWKVPETIFSEGLIRIKDPSSYKAQNEWPFSIHASEGAHRIITFDPPPRPNSKERVYGWLEKGIMINSRSVDIVDLYAQDPYNNSACALLFRLWHPALISSYDGARTFRMYNVDVAEDEAGGGAAQAITFIGYKDDGTTVTQEYTTDGIADGAGGADDFETLRFTEDFCDLVYVEADFTGLLRMDNLVISYDPGAIYPVQLEIIGPNEVREGDQERFGARAVYNDGSIRDVSKLPDWTATPASYGNFDQNGVLTAAFVDAEQELLIRSEYTESGVMVAAEKTITIYKRVARYYVNGTYGDDLNDGLTPASALATIQKGLDLCEGGEEVIVAQGVYYERIKINGKDVVLRSSDPQDLTVAAGTIIDGNHSGAVITFAGTETAACKVMGLTLTGGKSWEYGGGVCGNHTQAEISQCLIQGNEARIGGGGIAFVQGIISRCTIRNNYATPGGGGGIISVHGKINNCLIYDNWAYGKGGGIFDNSSEVTNCTIITNRSSGEGGGIRGNSSTIRNCIIRGNNPAEISYFRDNKPDVSYCNVRGGFEGTGNIDDDPLFVDVGKRNYRLQKGSPCIDAGCEAGVYEDMEGNVRPRDYPGVDNNGDLPEFDMGAYEYFYNDRPVADAGEDRVVYAGAEGWAEVMLDGSGSYDPDGDELTYKWSWSIEGQTFTCSGGDGRVNMLDYAVLARQWMPRDFGAGGTGAAADLAGFAGAWLKRPQQGQSPCCLPYDVAPESPYFTIELPLGVHVITLVVNDGFEDSEPNEVVITVLDNTPPEFALAVEPNMLWPPNHKMVLVTPAWTVRDNCDPAPAVSLVSITMNEGDETDTYDPAFDTTRGDGHTVDDIQVMPDGSIYLRAERSGRGEGRVYTLKYQAADAWGNVAVRTATVVVPHDMGSSE